MPLATQSPPAPRIGQRPLTILLVDEHDTDRDRMISLLKGVFPHGVEIRQADEGRRALELLERVPVDLVLLDNRLPDIDGLELIGRMADLADHTAVILMTSQGNDRLAARAIQQGAADYVVKPELNAEELDRVVMQALRTTRLERRNAQLVEQMRRTQGEMDHFVRALSHDMSVNFMMLEHSLKELKQNCEQAPLKNLTEGFAHVEAGMRESRRFLDDLAKLSQTGSVHVDPQRLELNVLLADVVFEQQELLGSRQIDVRIEADLPAVWCNENRVKQLFTNLIRNAARYGCDAKEPRIEITKIEHPDMQRDPNRIGLRVYDNGPGIPAHWHQDIFLPGRRLPDTKQQGTGMGLAIARKVVEHFGGTIFIDPHCQQGTAFMFSLPRPE